MLHTRLASNPSYTVSPIIESFIYDYYRVLRSDAIEFFTHARLLWNSSYTATIESFILKSPPHMINIESFILGSPSHTVTIEFFLHSYY